MTVFIIHLNTPYPIAVCWGNARHGDFYRKGSRLLVLKVSMPKSRCIIFITSFSRHHDWKQREIWMFFSNTEHWVGINCVAYYCPCLYKQSCTSNKNHCIEQRSLKPPSNPTFITDKHCILFQCLNSHWQPSWPEPFSQRQNGHFQTCRA